MLTVYPMNSSAAMARILAMVLVSDARLDDAEFEWLDKLNAYDLLGVTHQEFNQVLHAYCEDISDEAELDGRIHLIDITRIHQALDCVTDPKKRLVLCAIVLSVMKGVHQDLDDVELAMFTHMMDYWHITLDDVANAFTKTAV